MTNTDDSSQSNSQSHESATERKRSQERYILNLVYDTRTFADVTERERPDFALCQFETDSESFGVEITQIFPNQSIARLNLWEGYMHDLFAGGELRNKGDVRNLTVSDVTVTDKDGNVKIENMRAVLAPQPTQQQFRTVVAEAIRGKTERGYDTSELTHTNLVILDWFHLPFDSSRYSVCDVIDDEVRSALFESPFREVYLVIHDTTNRKDEDHSGSVTPTPKILPLQQLLIAERFYCTANVIDSRDDMECSDVGDLSSLVSEHITRFQGIGQVVDHDGLKCVRYRGSVVGLRESGLVLYDYGDYADYEPASRGSSGQIDPVAHEITTAVEGSTLSWGYVKEARSPGEVVE